MNSKQKRLLAMVLVCALTIGILPALSLPIFATGETAAVSGPVYRAAHADAMVMDGTQDDICLSDGKLSDGRGFDVLWNRSNLYFAVEPKEGDTSVSITVGGQKVIVNKNGTTSGINGATAAWGDVVEVSVPFTVTSYEQVAAMSISAGSASWSGTLLYSSLERKENVSKVGSAGWKLNGTIYWGGGAENELENGFRFVSSEVMTQSNSYRINLIGEFSVLKNHTANLNYEFDFCVNKMPVYKANKVSNTYVNYGMNILSTDGNGMAFMSAITNTKDGLIYAIVDAAGNYQYVTLGKQVGDQFHVRIEWTTVGTLALYIDGVLVKVFDNVTAPLSTMKNRGWGGTNYLACILKQEKTPEDESDIADITMTNICFGTSYDEHPLAGLDFSAISGKNEYATNVEYDLELMSSYVNPSGHFPAREITWDSDREDYITNEGKVSPGGIPLVVGLNAILKDDPTVNTRILVKVVRRSTKFLVTSKDQVTMTLDGRISEGEKVWQTEMPFSFTQGTGAPSGKLYGAWGQGNIYIAVEHKGAKTLELKLNRKLITLDLATGAFAGESYGARAKISGSIAEIYIPLLDLGLYAYEYEQVTRFEAKLVNGDKSASVSKYQMDLKLTSEVKYEQDLSTGELHGDPVISEDGTSVTLKPVLKEQSVQLNDLMEVNHSKDLTFSQTLQFTSLPISTGGINSLTDVSNGYNFWIIDGAADTVQQVLRAKIYNNASKGLVLQIVKDNELKTEEIVLGKAASATVPAFKLDVVWGADDSVKVYVDDALKGSVSNVNVTHEAGEMGSDGFRLHCAQSNITVTVTNISFTQPAAELNFAQGSVSGGATVGGNGNSVTLNTVSGGQVAEQSVLLSDLAAIDHSKDIVFVQKLSIGAMAAGNGGFTSITDTANGYNFWLIDGAADAVQAVLRGKIYNHATKGLVLQILKDNALAIEEIELGKNVGDSFQLKLIWSADGKVAVAVDGEKKGEVGVNVTYDGGQMGSDAIYLGCKAEGIKVTVSGVSLPQAPEKVSMVGATTVNDATVNADGSVTLNPQMTPQMIELKDLEALDHSKNILFSQKLTVTAMPVSTGNLNEQEGYAFALFAGQKTGPQNGLVARVYNDAAKGLVLQIVKNAAANTAENIELGKAEGDTFTLELLWNTDNSVKVSVDGTVKATVTGVNVTLTNGGMETNSLTMNCSAVDTKLDISDVIVRNVAGNINFNDMSNYKTQINASGTEATFTGSGDNRINQLTMSGLAQMDHTKNVMLSQTLNVVAMPVDEAMTNASPYDGNCYYFFMVDGASSGTTAGQKYLTMANLYNSSTKGLVLQVQTGSAGNVFAEVVLSKQVGDTFKLDYLWCNDGNVKVYVDGVMKGIVPGAVRAVMLNDSTCGYDSISLRKLNADTTVKVTNVSVEQINVVEFAKEDLSTINLLNASVTNGKLTMGQTNSVAYKDDITRVDHSKDLWFSQIVNVASMVEDQPMVKGRYINGKGYFFWINAGNLNAAKTMLLCNMYNSSTKGLILQVMKSDRDFEEVVLNKTTGNVFELAVLWGKDGSATVYVDGVEKGKVTDVDYTGIGTGNSYGRNRIHCAVNTSETLVYIYNMILDESKQMSEGIDLSGATASGAVTVNGATASFNMIPMQSVVKNGLEVIDHSKDMIFSQTIHVENMPTGSPMVANGAYQTIGTGYFFRLSGSGFETFTNIYHDVNKGLVLQVQTADGSFVDMVLDKQVGDTFTLQYLWNNDNSVKVYVDNTFKGGAAKAALSVASDNNGVAFSSAAANSKITVSDLTVEYIQIRQDLNAINLLNTSITNGKLTMGQSSSVAYKDDIARIDHSKDLWFSQMVNVASMVEDQPMVKGKYINGKGYFFWLNAGNLDAAKTMLLCNMYNSSTKGLILQVMKSDRDFEEVVLDKSIGNFFELAVLWGKDGSATVYVDGVEKGKVTDVDYTGIGTGNSYGRNRIHCAVNTSDTLVYAYNLVIGTSNENKQVWEGIDLSGATASGTVTVSGAAASFNLTPMQSIVQNGLEVIDHSKDMILKQTIQVSAMVAGNGMADAAGFNPVGTGYYFWMVDGASDANKSMTFANIYNSAADGLVLQVQQADGKVVNIKLDKQVGDTFQLVYLWGKDNTVKVYVDEVLKGSVANATAAVQGDGCGYDGYQMRSIGSGINVTISDANINNVSSGSSAKFDMQADYQIVILNGLQEVERSHDLTLSQNLTINDLPSIPMESGKNYQFVGTGYYFWLIDGKKDEHKVMAFGNIYNDENWGLILQVQNGIGAIVNVRLGKKVGDTFRLDFTWVMDGSVKVYVDGVHKGTVEKATRNFGYSNGSGYDGFQLRSRAFGADVIISDVYLTPGVRYTSVKNEITSATVLEPIVDLKNVTETNLKLPTTFESPYLGNVPLLWTSSDPAVWNLETGKITHGHEKVGKYTTLTASVSDIRTKQIFRVEAYSVGNGVVELKSPKLLNASFATNVVLDGEVTSTTDEMVTHEGWHLSTLIGDTGKFGVQWDTKNLYLALKDLKPEEANTLAIAIKGQAVDVSKAVKSDNFLEIAIPISTLGIATNNYGAEIAATVTLGNGTWAGTIRLTSTDWLASNTTAPGLPQSAAAIGAGARGGDQRTEYQGAVAVTDGWNFYDHYDINGFNPASIRTYSMLMSTTGYQEAWKREILEPLGDRSVANYHEFDFFAQYMPVYQLGTDDPTHSGFATCGFFWWVVGEHYSEHKTTAPTITLGVINTIDGLVMVVRGTKGDEYIILDKYLGDYFRIGVRWEVEGDVTVLIDNEKVGYVEDAQVDWYGFGRCGISLNTLRSTDAARSSNDNIDITITNLAMGLNYGDTLLDTLTWEVIRGKNVRDMAAVTRDVILMDTWQTSQLGTPQKVTWSSSNESVLNSKTGDVTRPEGNGELVYLTARCGGEERVFELYVKGRNPDGITMGVLKDKNPATGVGKPENETYWFTLDDNNNSLIYDQGETKKVNYIELTDTDEFNRLNESVLTIWYSDDNKSYEGKAAYTEIEENFKILRVGNKTYLYDFEIEARYIKVHGCHYKATEADFVGIMKEMLRVGYSDVFGDGDTEFATESKVTISNENDYQLYDRYFKISLADSGVNCLKEDKSDVRFFLGNELLYHYFDGTNFVVRVPDIPAGGSVALTVLSGNANAMDISNKEYVYEVVYGTREAYQDEISRWYLEMPNGDLWSFKDDGSGTVGYRVSTDKGMTWTSSTPMQNVQDAIGEPTGALFDDETGRLIVYSWNRNSYGACVDSFVYSDDMGVSWKIAKTRYEGREPEYSISYSSPVKVCSYDGYGPGVDYVLNTADFLNYWDSKETNEPPVSCTRVLYTTDCGETWTMGATEIKYDEGEGVFLNENGLSEATIMEDSTGRLVLLARNQWGNADQFAMAYSYDHGITWETEKGKGSAKLSGVYSSNTQPIMFKYQGGKYLCWGGNNVLGGGSYQRFPMSIGVSLDDLNSFENIQDLYSRLSCQGMTVSARTNVVNQTVAAQGNSLTMAWVIGKATIHFRIDDFHDFFYRTRSAYDSFENSTVKYEGWATGVGMAESSDKYATDGKYSMQIGSYSAVARSVPYVQNGKISFDLYLENKDTAEFELELESAYGVIHGKAAPIAMTIRDGKIYALNADHTGEVEITAQLKNGWNHFEFDLALAQETSEATMSVNGGNAVAVPVDQAIGDYVCYVHITSLQKDYLYLDSFFLDDQDAQYVPDQEIEAEVEELTEVPETLKETYTDADGIITAMQDAIVESKGNIFTAENMAAYNVTLNYTRDGGANWTVAKNELIPTDGVTIKLPYPEGTSAQTHTFSAAMMGTSNSYRLGLGIGEIEILNVENGEDGVLVTVKGHGPVVLAWSETGSAPVVPDNGGEATAPDNTWIIIVIAAVVALALAGAVVVIILKKKSAAPAPAETDETPNQE